MQITYHHSVQLKPVSGKASCSRYIAHMEALHKRHAGTCQRSQALYLDTKIPDYSNTLKQLFNYPDNLIQAKQCRQLMLLPSQTEHSPHSHWASALHALLQCHMTCYDIMDTQAIGIIYALEFAMQTAKTQKDPIGIIAMDNSHDNNRGGVGRVACLCLSNHLQNTEITSNPSMQITCTMPDQSDSNQPYALISNDISLAESLQKHTNCRAIHHCKQACTMLTTLCVQLAKQAQDKKNICLAVTHAHHQPSFIWILP